MQHRCITQTQPACRICPAVVYAVYAQNRTYLNTWPTENATPGVARSARDARSSRMRCTFSPYSDVSTCRIMRSTLVRATALVGHWRATAALLGHRRTHCRRREHHCLARWATATFRRGRESRQKAPAVPRSPCLTPHLPPLPACQIWERKDGIAAWQGCRCAARIWTMWS